ncbi:aminodeoxychorismate synthase component I [Variovorax sp. J22R133]|uniref:aminodeoxychorismate synthase component I n=1 Tax=Variovorax brevis TaxID=3053503 RepID=UPI0025769B71|nr:aminodeoxychorismate synthase component I [Variovorax sp. J22R133]MDM0115993.1 aminodeoxychorismate synthase component I [Variovorax sp. J22R133]
MSADLRCEAECFALLDDRDATREHPTSRLYQSFVREHRCTDPAGLDATWRDVDADLRSGLHAVLLADYEWGAKLVKAGHDKLPRDDASSLRVLMFRELTRLSSDEASAWLESLDQDASAATGVMNLTPSVDHPAFIQAIAQIHEAIAAGETYQVNYTFRLHGEAYGSPISLYRRLRRRQPVSYGAFIALPASHDDASTTHVLSCSPELFLRHQHGTLTARPMKGTASRISAEQGPEGDSEAARHLSIDTKNRAENVMIVDLLRNDLGRLAQIGSVKVAELFAIEPYSTVFQMTSTVQARLKPEIAFPDVLRAAFPCGSITGAPKHHTMQLIAGLESTPRGLYCGAIGWMDAPQGDARIGDFCFSVAIRTLTLREESQGLRPVRMGIGAGIVVDSVADDEFEECHLKGRFLTGLDPGFELFETMLVTKEEGAAPVVHHLDRHLQRMARSAQVLGFGFHRDAALDAVLERTLTLATVGKWRMRLALSHDGGMQLQHAALGALPGDSVTLLIANERLPNANPLAAHKTTLRKTYDEGVRAAERAGAFDSLYFTHDGRLAEGARTSVFVKLDDQWFTPPVADGALPGVMRGCLLEDPSWSATERSLSLQDLQEAQAIVVCNALRGALSARLLQGEPAMGA